MGKHLIIKKDSVFKLYEVKWHNIFTQNENLEMIVSTWGLYLFYLLYLAIFDREEYIDTTQHFIDCFLTIEEAIEASVKLKQQQEDEKTVIFELD